MRHLFPVAIRVAATSYEHDQASPSTAWTIVHNLGHRPGGVYVVDTSGSQWEGSVTHLDANTLTITFNAPFAGRAYLS